MSQSSSGGPGWQLEGNAPLAYDTYIVDVFLQDYSRRLVEVAAIKPGDRVLDVACGTGVVTHSQQIRSVLQDRLSASISTRHAHASTRFS